MRSITTLSGTIGTVCLGLALTGCDALTGIDNYDAPGSELSGQILHNGQPVQLRTGGVELELWEPAYGSREKIPIYVAQDGTFSAIVFDGDYRLNTIANNGPWMNSTDTLTISVRGDTEVDVPVQPYFLVQNPQITYNASGGPGGSVTATFNVSVANPGRDLDFVGLYVGTTSFVDRINRLVQLERPRAQLPVTWMTDPITLTVALPENVRVTQSPDPREHVFVRVGVKSTGLAEMIFSPLVKLPI